MSSTDPLAASDEALEQAGEGPERRKRSPLIPLLSILLAIVGGALIAWSFIAGLTSYFDHPHAELSSIYIALFFVGLGIVIVGIAFALVSIIRRSHLTISLIGLVLSMLPSLVTLVIAALLFL
jgi:hypothetical protein